MRCMLYLFADILLILLATLTAIVLRDNFDVSLERAAVLGPYLLSTVLVSSLLLPLFGANRVIWRFTTLPDHLRISGVISATVVGTVLLVFAFNRLELVPRSLPFLQFNVAMIFLVGARVLFKLHHNARCSRRRQLAPLKVADEAAAEMVLLVGLSQLTETYLHSIAELAPRAIRVAGILGRKERHIGRLVASHKVLGLPEQLDRVLDELEVKGIAVDRIVVTATIASFSREERRALAAAQRHRSIKVQYLSQELGFEPASSQERLDARSGNGQLAGAGLKFEIAPDELESMRKRTYWKVKRAIDVSVSLLLLTVLFPLLVILGLAVAVTIGWPLVFWQQRPGLGARPFRLYKLRTFGPALATDGRKLSDEERASRFGNFLRRTRLDELPQLFNILRGDMSFIGPRPLLPRDQHEAYRARLLVRPGLSGWAQVVGGRTISPEDKAALDIWYVRNANLMLDIGVVLRTIPMVVFGERISRRLIERAWRDLRKAGVLKGSLATLEGPRTAAAA